jgi:hypothetical protein
LLTLPEKLIKIGAKVVRHGRYVTFQLAEAAVSRALLAQILGLIADLRAPPPGQHDGGRKDERSRSSGEVRPGTHALCLCGRIHSGGHQRIIGMTLRLIWFNDSGRDLSQL